MKAMLAIIGIRRGNNNNNNNETLVVNCKARTASTKPELGVLYRKQLNNNENHKAKSHLVSQAANNLHHTHTPTLRTHSRKLTKTVNRRELEPFGRDTGKCVRKRAVHVRVCVLRQRFLTEPWHPWELLHLYKVTSSSFIHSHLKPAPQVCADTRRGLSGVATTIGPLGLRGAAVARGSLRRSPVRGRGATRALLVAGGSPNLPGRSLLLPVHRLPILRLPILLLLLLGRLSVLLLLWRLTILLLSRRLTVLRLTVLRLTVLRLAVLRLVLLWRLAVPTLQQRGKLTLFHCLTSS